MALKTDYKDDVFTGNRKYQQTNNSDGTISLTDVTEYSQEGDVFASDDINSTNTEINELSTEIAGLNGSKTITISTGSWSSSTTTVNGTEYYTYTTSLTKVYATHPDVLIGSTGTVPSTAEQTAFDLVKYVTVNGTTLKLYATTKPSSDFVIIVKGVA